MLSKDQLDAVSKVSDQALLHHIYYHINNVAAEICDHYCKYPHTWDEELEGSTLIDTVCKNCPLSKMLE